MIASATVPESELAKLPIALRAIAGAAGVAGRDALRGFAGVVLKAAAGATPVSTKGKSIMRARTRSARKTGVSRVGSAAFGTTVNTGRKGGKPGLIWFRTRGGKYQLAGTVSDRGTVRPSWRHYSRQGWDDISYKATLYAQTVAEQMKYAAKTIGLARQSWVQIADALGIRLEDVKGGGRLSASAVAQARRAVTSNGQSYANGLGVEERRNKTLFLKLINRYPRGQKLGFDRTLAGVLVGQVRYFERNMELGVFNSIEKTVRAYPFLKAIQRA